MSDQLNPQNSPRSGRHRLDDDFDDFADFDNYSDYPVDVENASGNEADYVESARAEAGGASGDRGSRGNRDGRADYGDRYTASEQSPRRFRRSEAAGAVGAADVAESAEPAYAGPQRNTDHRTDEYLDEYADANRDASRYEDTSAYRNDSGDVGDGAGDGRYMRILAIVLLVVGVCLVAYGAYALATRDHDSGDAAASGTATSTPLSSSTSGAPATSAPSTPAANPSEGDNVSPPPPPTESGQPVPPPPAVVDNAAPTIDRKAVRVSVLNNSAVVGLADDISSKMGEQGWGAGETGNAPENEMGVWEHTTVYFDANNEMEKAAAEQIAHDNGWVAEPRDERLRNAPGGVVVIATDPAA